MYWVDTESGHHCTRHDYEFARGEVCHGCITDPGDSPGELANDPAYQKALRARISEYQANGRAALRKSNELYDKCEWNTAAKYEDTSIKWARLAEERQDILDSRAHDLELVQHEREMSGQRRGN